MELKQIRGSKSLKLLFLLLTSLLIASVSASVYYTMYMNATVGVVGDKIQFYPGPQPDWTTIGGSISTPDRQTVTFASMNGAAGAGTTYPNSVFICNNDTSSSHNIELTVGSWSGSAGAPNLNNITITMLDATNAAKGASIVLIPGGNGSPGATGNQTIGIGAVWHVEWNIYWKSSATAGVDSVTVDLKLMVWS
jgi:hypothetical protein